MFEFFILIGGKIYWLRLVVNIYGYFGSFMEYEFIINFFLYGGICGINLSLGNDNVYLWSG